MKILNKKQILVCIISGLLQILFLIAMANAKQPRKLRGLKIDQCRTENYGKIEYETVCRHRTGFLTYRLSDLGNGDLFADLRADVINP